MRNLTNLERIWDIGRRRWWRGLKQCCDEVEPSCAEPAVCGAEALDCSAKSTGLRQQGPIQHSQMIWHGRFLASAR